MKIRKGAVSGTILVLALFLIAWVYADAIVYTEAKLNADDAGKGDSFGVSLAVSGELLVAGASHGVNDSGINTGAAYVFRKVSGTWDQEQKLLASGGAANDMFGASADIAGDVLVLGSFWADQPGAIDAGAAYVFRHNGSNWLEEQKITLPGAQASDLIGASVGTSGNRIIVSGHGVGSVGRAFVYRYNGTSWVLEGTLGPSDGASGDQFGLNVDIYGNVAVVGSKYDSDDGTWSGSVYVFRFNGTSWAQEQKLKASDAAAGDEFGNSVSVFGDLVAVGAYMDDGAGTDRGAVYIFRYNGSTWVEEDTLTAPDAADNDLFGRYVSAGPDNVIVGAIHDDDNGSDSGAAYVFRYSNTWFLEGKIIASDGQGGDNFGWDVSGSGINFGISSPNGASGAVTDTGAVYVYNRPCSAGSTPLTWYPDFDSDGYGDRFTPMVLCQQEASFVADGTDCDDANASVHPGATEVCDDGIDNDCDGYFDADDSDCKSDGGGGGGGCNTVGRLTGGPIWPDLIWLTLLGSFLLFFRKRV